MRIYKIDACCFGHYWEHDVKCPPRWRGSGCYDVEVECYQEATFEVVAEGLAAALKLLTDQWDKLNKDWSHSADDFWYDPDTVTSREDDGDGPAEVLEYQFKEPVDGADYDIPARYSEEVEL